MIHPLNLLRIELLARTSWTEAEAGLFCETVTGIAAGMQTPGKAGHARGSHAGGWLHPVGQGSR